MKLSDLLTTQHKASATPVQTTASRVERLSADASSDVLEAVSARGASVAGVGLRALPPATGGAVLPEHHPAAVAQQLWNEAQPMLAREMKARDAMAQGGLKSLWAGRSKRASTAEGTLLKALEAKPFDERLPIVIALSVHVMRTASKQDIEQFSRLPLTHGLNVTSHEWKAIERFGDHFEIHRNQYFAATNLGAVMLPYEETLSALHEYTRLNPANRVFGMVFLHQLRAQGALSPEAVETAETKATAQCEKLGREPWGQFSSEALLNTGAALGYFLTHRSRGA